LRHGVAEAFDLLTSHSA